MAPDLSAMRSANAEASASGPNRFALQLAAKRGCVLVEHRGRPGDAGIVDQNADIGC